MRTHHEPDPSEDARVWRELIDRLIARGATLTAAIGVADGVIQARHLRTGDDDIPSEPPPPSRANPGGEEPLG